MGDSHAGIHTQESIRRSPSVTGGINRARRVSHETRLRYGSPRAPISRPEAIFRLRPGLSTPPPSTGHPDREFTHDSGRGDPHLSSPQLKLEIPLPGELNPAADRRVCSPFRPHEPRIRGESPACGDERTEPVSAMMRLKSRIKDQEAFTIEAAVPSQASLDHQGGREDVPDAAPQERAVIEAGFDDVERAPGPHGDDPVTRFLRLCGPGGPERNDRHRKKENSQAHGLLPEPRSRPAAGRRGTDDRRARPLTPPLRQVHPRTYSTTARTTSGSVSGCRDPAQEAKIWMRANPDFTWAFPKAVRCSLQNDMGSS